MAGRQSARHRRTVCRNEGAAGRDSDTGSARLGARRTAHVETPGREGRPMGDSSRPRHDGDDPRQRRASRPKTIIERKAMPNITPCLWFDKNAEEAVKFYTSIFKNSKVVNISRYTEAGYEVHHMAAGTVLTRS